MNKCKTAIEDMCDCTNCCIFCQDECDSMCDVQKENCPYMVEVEGMTDLQVMKSTIPEVLQVFTEMTVQMKKLEESSKILKAKILEAMELNGIKKFENDYVTFTYVAPTVRESIDSAKLKKNYPDIADECTKASKVSASVRIKVK